MPNAQEQASRNTVILSNFYYMPQKFTLRKYGVILP